MSLKTNDAFDNLFDYYGQIYNVDPALTKTVFHLESSGNPATKDSPAGAQGGMQIMPQLAQHYGIDPHDMTQAIPAATAYLAEGLQATGGNPAGALAYYNGGPKTLQRWLPETQGYVAKAQSYYPQIQMMQLAANGPPPGTATDTPVQYADAAPNEQAFRSRWGLPGGAAQSPAGPDENAFRERWGLNPPAAAPSASPPSTGTKPAAASDAAMSAPDNLGDTAMTTAQLAASRARSAQAPYSSLEPSEPGFAHLLYSLGELPMRIGETALGYHPVPSGPGTTALSEASVGAGLGDLRFGNPLSFKSPAAAANPLARAPAIEPPPPSFAPTGRTFEVDAQGNVTQSGLPAVQPAAAGAPPNPLVSRAATPIAPLTAPVAPSASAVAPLTPAEQLGYASMASKPPAALPGASPGPPPGAPQPGVPGYTPTTPGINPANAPGLSPAEVAAYASMHDTPPPAPMFPPVTKAGAEALADQIVQYFHTGNGVQAGMALPPGYHPTLTGLTNDPGLATLHRGLESVSGTPAVIAQHNAQAINEAAAKLQGQPGDANAMAAQVNTVTTPLREAAFANKTDMDPAKVQTAVDKANEILTGPDSKRPGVVKYVTQVRDSLLDTKGRPETDPEQMYGAHKNINDLLSPLAQSTDADKAAASASLMKLKPLVQNAIESGAPGFKAYMAKHAEMMRPVDAQRLLESLNLTNATGDTRLAAVDSAIKAIEKQRQMPGARKADSVTDDQMGELVALRNALRMEASRGTGKPINSTTFQNLATNSIVSRIGGSPLTGMLGGHLIAPGLGELAGYGASKAAESVFGRAEGLVRDALLERILNFSGKGEATLAQPQGVPRRGPLNSGPFSSDAYRAR